jgi:Protein of unknown function (DUF3050)
MPNDDIDHLVRLRDTLLDHPLYENVVSVGDLRCFMEDHVFAVWDFMSLLKRLQQDMTCTKVPWFPADNPKAAHLINEIVIGEETDADSDGLFASHLELYLRAMWDVGASTAQFDTFSSMVRAGDSVGVALARAGVARHVRTFVTNTMTQATTGTTEEVLAAFFYGREDIIPEMFRRLLKTLYGTNYENHNLRHFIYYIDRHIELDGDSHGPKGKELLEDLLKNAPDKAERAMRTACSSIEARIAFWDGTLGKLHDRHDTRSAAQA